MDKNHEDGVGSDLAVVDRALAAAQEYFVHRDQMNAVVHLASVRYSPVTELVRQGCAAAARLRGETPEPVCPAASRAEAIARRVPGGTRG